MFCTKKEKKIELSKKMTAQLRQQVVLKTGYSYRYVCCVIDPKDKRYNEQVVEVCEKLIAAQEEAFKSINIKIKRLK